VSEDANDDCLRAKIAPPPAGIDRAGGDVAGGRRRCPAAGRAAALRLGPGPAGLRGGRGLHDRPYRQLFADPAFWQAARNTLEFATITTVGAVLIGGGAAVACSRTNILGRRAWRRLLLLPILLPPLGVILGWNALYGPGGYAAKIVRLNLTSVIGMSVLGTVVAMPITFLICRHRWPTSSPLWRTRRATRAPGRCACWPVSPCR
jgi:ABC-type Fe3+ transport system permease subunit